MINKNKIILKLGVLAILFLGLYSFNVIRVLNTLGSGGYWLKARAAQATGTGSLIKMDGISSVYYLGDDNKRYVFPSESVYFSWYQDFNDVLTIPATTLQSYPLGGNIVMRAGTKLIKITTDPAVYAVEPGGAT